MRPPEAQGGNPLLDRVIEDYLSGSDEEKSSLTPEEPLDGLFGLVKQLGWLRGIVSEVIMKSPYIQTDQKDPLKQGYDRVFLALLDAHERSSGKIPATSRQRRTTQRIVKNMFPDLLPH